jgi:hypothetical protein
MRISHSLFGLGRFSTSIGIFSGVVLGDRDDLDLVIAKDMQFKYISRCHRNINSRHQTLFRIETTHSDVGYNTEFSRLFHAGNRNIVFSYECVE